MVASTICSRACTVATNDSSRSSTHFTGLPVAFAASVTAVSSG